MLDVLEEKDRLKELTDKLIQVKESSSNVKEWLAINQEVFRQQKHLNMLSSDSKIYELKKEYIDTLNEFLTELSESKEVQNYIRISEKISTTLSSKSSFMRKIKSDSPELHSWIAINKKRAYYEDSIRSIMIQSGFRDQESLNKLVENLRQVNIELANFRKMYQESVDKWEELYSLKSVLK